MKLTIAEYRVAGDRRIQSIGVVPDVQLLPVQLSFTGAVQAVNAFAAVWQAARPGERAEVAARLRALVAEQRVGDRPNRSEPRARKRRPKQYPLLKHPRQQARKLAGKGRYD